MNINIVQYQLLVNICQYIGQVNTKIKGVLQQSNAATDARGTGSVFPGRWEVWIVTPPTSINHTLIRTTQMKSWKKRK